MSNVGTGAKQIPVMGNHMRNLIEGSDIVMSHILHFYHLAALDYINATGTPIDGQAPWSPKDNTDDMVTNTPATGSTGLATDLVMQYVTALDIRRMAHQMQAYASGKQPCTPALIPGGVTKVVDANMAASMSGVLNNIQSFINTTYLPTVVTVAKAFSGDLLVGTAARGVGKGCGKFLAYGTFPNSAGSQFLTGGFLNATAASVAGNWTLTPLNPANIKEHITYSYYDQGTASVYDRLHPSVGVTKPSYTKAGAYSWLKAPRYETTSASADCNVAEVGPLARVLVNYVAGLSPWVQTTNLVLTGASYLNFAAGLLDATVIPGLRSVLGRHAARCIEAKVIADEMQNWLAALTTTAATGETYKNRNLPKQTSSGYGLTEAPRGALGHWITVSGKKIQNYQAVVPTTWNMGPKDAFGQNGPIEQALNGMTGITDDATGRTRVGRIVRSFDPCIACAVHIVSPDKKTISKFEVVPPGVINSCK